MSQFIIVGERRSGTSTLAKWIEIHPEIYLHPTMDEAYFLDDSLRGRMDWMDGQIDPSLWGKQKDKQDYLDLFKNKTEQQVCFGEKSADYFFWDPCLERIKSNFPDVKILLTFRHPVKRAWSHYWNEVGKGREKLTFDQAVEQEAERANNSDYAKLHLSYVERGKYVVQLKRWMEAFGKDNIHIIVLEDLIAEPLSTIQGVYQFLDVDPNKGLERLGKRYNSNWTTIPKKFWTKNEILIRTENKYNEFVKKLARKVQSDPVKERKLSLKLQKVTRKTQDAFTMNPLTKNKLAEVFKPYNQELAELIDNKLEGWHK